MQPTYPSVQQPPPAYPPAPPPPPPQPVHAPAATRAPSTTDDLKAVAKGVAGVARLVGKGAAALGTAAVKAGAASASASSASAHQSQASHHPSAPPPRYGRAAAPYVMHTVAPPPAAMFRAAPAFAAAPVPHAPPRRETEHSTCWCGFRDDPEMAPCARAAAKAALFPLAAVAYPLGAALWAALQAHYCVFSCCMVHHVHATTQSAARGGARHAASQRDVVDCWQCQAEAWVWLDNVNGNCWVCELPVSKRVLRGHIVEAPCQLCLWGSER